MSTAHAVHGHSSASHPAASARPDTVKNSLTPGRRARLVENDDYAAFARRILGPTPAASRTATSKLSPSCSACPPTSTLPSARPSPACARTDIPGPRSAPGSALPARPPSNAGAAPHDRRDPRPRPRTLTRPRHLARRLGITVTALRALVRIRYVKVAEYQARGVVHFHAVIRLDRAPDPGLTDDSYDAPDPFLTADLLCEAIDRAVAAVSLAVEHHGQVVTLGFGTQTDRGSVHRDTIVATGEPLKAEAVANYIAKYATKTLTAPGVPDTRIRHAAEITALRCSAHYRAMITAAWHLGSRHATDQQRFRLWAHMLGYGGHFLTKSRRYSVTLGQLRKARADHRRAARHPGGECDPWGRPLDETVVLVISTWTYAGTGYTAAADVQLALASAARAREHR
jgi:hypothetical protein